MKRSALFFAVLLLNCAAASSDVSKRPRIFGIAYVRIQVSDVEKAKDFYSLALQSTRSGLSPDMPCDWCERAPIASSLGEKRLGPVELEGGQTANSSNLLKQVAFLTDNAEKLRGFLRKSGLAPGKLKKCGEDPCFSISDPESHQLVFVQQTGISPIEIPGAYSAAPFRSPIIHAGFVVHDPAAEDKFYKDILGFHLYWQGGRQDGQTDWVNMQVPDGTDWIEYMLNIPPDANHKRLGVANHIALGVPDIHAAQKMLIDHGAKLTEEPKIGRGGKWQLNLYDPDDTRVEFMEFTPAQKPCCSDYTGPHPGPESPSKAPAKP